VAGAGGGVVGAGGGVAGATEGGGGPWWDDFDILLQHPVGLRHGGPHETNSKIKLPLTLTSFRVIKKVYFGCAGESL
jgi:hypothetical protein